MAIQEEIALESNQSKVGKTLQVVCDSVNDEYYVCRSQYDSPEVDPEVLVRKGDTEMKKGDFYNVKIVDAMPFELIAELAE
jgi:ribosomal protein S12 methylthiotransferase